MSFGFIFCTKIFFFGLDPYILKNFSLGPYNSIVLISAIRKLLDNVSFC